MLDLKEGGNIFSTASCRGVSSGPSKIVGLKLVSLLNAVHFQRWKINGGHMPTVQSERNQQIAYSELSSPNYVNGYRH